MPILVLRPGAFFVGLHAGLAHQRRNGVELTARFGIADLLHPLDQSSRQQLEVIPLFPPTVRKYQTATAGRRPRQALLSGALRLGPRLLPEIYGLLPPACAALGIPEPELYLMRGDANARSVGHDRTAIVIYNRLLEDLAVDEIEAVLAHECGHILAGHILYRQMAQAAMRTPASGPGRSLFTEVPGLAGAQIQAALFNWYRRSELTADRAAAAYLGSAEPMQRAMLRILGVPRQVGEVSADAVLEQAAELDQISEPGRWDRSLTPDLDNATGHPMAALRIRELATWTESGGFRHLAGVSNPA
jgi:Zn-dependent protease with chaperone function